MTTNKPKNKALRRGSAWFSAWLAVFSTAFADSELPPVEHSDCIIEPMVVVEVGTSVPGVIESMLVERSDRIEAGQPLARLESSVEEVTVQRSRLRAEMRSEIRARQAELELARQKMRRIDDLFERGASSNQQRDEAVAELERADQAVKIAEEKLRLARLDLEHAKAQLERRVIRSPISGVVLERLAQAGEYVDERPLMTVAQLNPLRVEVLMPAQSFGSVRPGMAARVLPELAVQDALRAEVVLVDPVIDTASGTFGVRLELPNGDYSIPGGMRCRVSFLDSGPEHQPVAAESGSDGFDDAGFLAPMARPPEAVAAAATAASLQTDGEGPEGRDPGGADPEPGTPSVVPAVAEAVPTPPVPVPAREPGAAPASEDGAGTCWRIGPWSSPTHRDALARELNAAGVGGAPHQDVERKARQWMVYLPGRDGRDTDEKLERLSAAGYSDIFVFRRGNRRGDISLGLYDRRKNAETRRQAVRNDGFDAKLARRFDSVPRYWLLAGDLGAAELAEVHALAEVPVEPMSCSAGEETETAQPRPPGQFLSHAD